MTAPRELTTKRGADIAAFALIKVACKEAELILEVLDGLTFERDRNICDACAGTGTPTSGPGCMCGGSGKMSDAAHYLRERYAAEHVRANGLQSLLDRLRLVSTDADLTEAGLRYEILQILSVGAGT